MIGWRGWSPCSSFPSQNIITRRTDKHREHVSAAVVKADYPAIYLARIDRTDELRSDDETGGYPNLRLCALYRGYWLALPDARLRQGSSPFEETSGHLPTNGKSRRLGGK